MPTRRPARFSPALGFTFFPGFSAVPFALAVRLIARGTGIRRQVMLPCMGETPIYHLSL